METTGQSTPKCSTMRQWERVVPIIDQPSARFMRRSKAR